MRVRAIREGYYAHGRRRIGTEFDLQNPEKDFSARWMEKVEDEDERPRSRASKPARQDAPVSSKRTVDADVI
jgi:hypothetical protein